MAVPAAPQVAAHMWLVFLTQKSGRATLRQLTSMESQFFAG